MLRYETVEKIRKIKMDCLDIALYPIRYMCIPICKVCDLYDEYRKNRKYSYKKILKLVQYCIDYHLNYNDVMYVVFDDYVGEDAECYGCYGYNSLTKISSLHQKVKNAIKHVYRYQTEDYIRAIKEICADTLSEEDKKIEFTNNYVYCQIQDKGICKIQS